MNFKITLSRNKLKEQILRLEQGFPQNWIYIERKIQHPLKSIKNEGVKASKNYLGKLTSEIFHQDLLNIYNQKITKIRPIIGPNGVGKTTLLKYHIKNYMDQLAPNSNLFLFFDFKSVTDNVKEFWPIFIQNLIEQLYNEEDQNFKIREIIDKIPRQKRRIELVKIFRNKEIVDNILKLASFDPDEQYSALEYFYNEISETKKISDLFYGILKLGFQLNYLITIAFDEIQFLDEIDSSNKLLKLFLEKFIRYLMEQFSDKKLYLLVSCLENPNNKEWSTLISHSKNFQTIVNNKEIILNNLLKEERDEIIKQVADKIGFEEKDRKIYFKKVKNSLLYYLPRELLGCIARVIDSMDYVGYTDYDIRTIYEEDARNYVKDILIDKKFVHIEPKAITRGGYEIDIYATSKTNRAGYINKAFGEVSMTKKPKMKNKIEKFSNWLYRMKDREYNPDKGDYAFFICPLNRMTKGTMEVLNGNNIELFEFVSPNIELLQSKFTQTNDSECMYDEKKAIQNNNISIKKEESSSSLIIIKESKYNLKDVPGIGDAKEKLLNNSDIYSIKDLLNCNVKIISQKTKGIGITSLNKWKQNAKQILEQ